MIDLIINYWYGVIPAFATMIYATYQKIVKMIFKRIAENLTEKADTIKTALENEDIKQQKDKLDIHNLEIRVKEIEQKQDKIMSYLKNHNKHIIYLYKTKDSIRKSYDIVIEKISYLKGVIDASKK